MPIRGRLLSAFLFPLFDEPGDGGGGGAIDKNAGGGSNDGGAGKAAGDPKNNGTADPGKPANANSGGTNEDYEKRFKGVTSDLQKERKQRQQYEKDLAAAKAEIATEKARIQALVGAAPKSASDEETEAIRKRFREVFPELGEMTADDIKALREFKSRQAALDATNEHYWSQHSTKMVGSVQAEIAKEIGGKLTNRQMQRIARAYMLQAESDPEFLERHTHGDETLIKEFAKEFVEDWFEPARRKVTQQETQRFRAVPDGKGRGIITHGEQKIDVTNDKQVEDLLVKGFRERNGEFGRR